MIVALYTRAGTALVGEVANVSESELQSIFASDASATIVLRQDSLQRADEIVTTIVRIEDIELITFPLDERKYHEDCKERREDAELANLAYMQARLMRNDPPAGPPLPF